MQRGYGTGWTVSGTVPRQSTTTAGPITGHGHPSSCRHDRLQLRLDPPLAACWGDFVQYLASRDVENPRGRLLCTPQGYRYAARPFSSRHRPGRTSRATWPWLRAPCSCSGSWCPDRHRLACSHLLSSRLARPQVARGCAPKGFQRHLPPPPSVCVGIRRLAAPAWELTRRCFCIRRLCAQPSPTRHARLGDQQGRRASTRCEIAPGRPASHARSGSR